MKKLNIVAVKKQIKKQQKEYFNNQYKILKSAYEEIINIINKTPEIISVRFMPHDSSWSDDFSLSNMDIKISIPLAKEIRVYDEFLHTNNKPIKERYYCWIEIDDLRQTIKESKCIDVFNFDRFKILNAALSRLRKINDLVVNSLRECFCTYHGHYNMVIITAASKIKVTKNVY